MMKELVPFLNYELAENLDNLFLARLRCQDAKTELNEIIEKIDGELMRRMKEQGITEFTTGMEGKRQRVYVSKDKKDTINVAEMKKLIADDKMRDLALMALGNNQNAWKAAEVRTVQDTLGRKDLIETEWFDTVKVKSMPEYKAKVKAGEPLDSIEQRTL